MTTNLVVADAELVAVNLTARGTHEGTIQGVPPTGRQWAATCSAFYRVVDGRIADSWMNWDLLGILNSPSSSPSCGGTDACAARRSSPSVEQLGGVRRAETASA